MVVNLYTDISAELASNSGGLVPLCFVFGQIFGAALANFFHRKPILIVTSIIGRALLAAVAADPENMNLPIGLLIPGTFGVGVLDGIAIAMSTFPLRSQEAIGTAGGMSGAIRSTGSSIATVVYGTILSNQLAKFIPSLVTNGAVAQGLPKSSVAALISDLQGTTALTMAAIPGLTPAVLAAARVSYKHACAKAYKTVFLATLSLGGLGCIFSWFAVGVPRDQEDFVAGHIHKPKDESALEHEG